MHDPLPNSLWHSVLHAYHKRQHRMAESSIQVLSGHTTVFHQGAESQNGSGVWGELSGAETRTGSGHTESCISDRCPSPDILPPFPASLFLPRYAWTYITIIGKGLCRPIWTVKAYLQEGEHLFSHPEEIPNTPVAPLHRHEGFRKDWAVCL